MARCVHGLEPILAEEILELGLGTITRMGPREVHFRTRGPQPRVTGLRTADDVFLLAARCEDVGAARRDAAGLARLAGLADPGRLLRLRGEHGGPGAFTGVEVSASFVGGRNFNRYDAEDAVGRALARRLGVDYHSRRAGTAPPAGHSGWRVTLDGAYATLMLRVAGRPLHRRDYKRCSIPGTLHPPLAAAMARMAGIRPGHRVLDPCCGAGTLLIEAGGQQPEARLYGFDLAWEALRAAGENAAGTPVTVGRADAGRLPVPDGAVDRVLSNPPWGGQVTAGGLLAAAPSRWWAELRRVLAPGGQAVVLLPDVGGLAAGIAQGLVPTHLQRIRVSGAVSFLVRLASSGGPSGMTGWRPTASSPAGRRSR
ncbi:methyltransferase domain-containing protein [Planobispora siamensis]|uniref:RNA methyltransferase n=1 Tax=Planobispora siamensis TaxID=936338 RepID=A0A8J3WMX4_9ACTN|nr:methyltransferase domain-containing protein [Planobispora siamensis]GIH96979.1 RNA methyltransferase [Planobispora siamensis]